MGKILELWRSLGEIGQGIVAVLGVFGSFALMVMGLLRISNRASNQYTREMEDLAKRLGMEYIDVPIANDIPAIKTMHPEMTPEQVSEKRNSDLEEIAQHTQKDIRTDKERGETLDYFEIAKEFNFPQDIRLYSRGDAGHIFTASSFLRGRRGGAELYVFNYSFRSEMSDDYVDQTVARFKSAAYNFPAFALSPENRWEKLKSAFGGQDIDFKSHRDFSRTYHLQGKDEDAVRTLFGPETLSFFEDKGGLCVEAAKDEVIIYRSGKTVKPSNVESFIDTAAAVLAQLRR